MNLNWSIGLICVAAGMLGALAGTAIILRIAHVGLQKQLRMQINNAVAPLLQLQLDLQLNRLMDRLTERVPTQTVLQTVSPSAIDLAPLAQQVLAGFDLRFEAQAHAIGQVQVCLESWRAQPSQLVAANPAVPLVDLAPLTRQLADAIDLQLAARFEAQAQASADAQQRADQSLHQTLQRVLQLVQQAIQVELEFQASQQNQRDHAQLQHLQQEQGRWQAAQNLLDAQRDARHAARLQAALQAITAPNAGRIENAAPAPAPSATAAGTVMKAPSMARSAAAALLPVSARPPELLLTPIAQPAPVYVQGEPARELTDEELDALPPELPSDKLRRRKLPAPKAPTLRNI